MTPWSAPVLLKYTGYQHLHYTELQIYLPHPNLTEFQLLSGVEVQQSVLKGPSGDSDADLHWRITCIAATFIFSPSSQFTACTPILQLLRLSDAKGAQLYVIHCDLPSTGKK